MISEIGERLLDDPATLFNLEATLTAFVEGWLIPDFTERFEVELVAITFEDGELSISTAFDGPINGAQVFFDSNFNGILDSFEPRVISGSDGTDGSFALAIPLTRFDVNGNGVIDPFEGHIVVEGGVDQDTFQFQAVEYTSQAGWAVVSPLTLLATELDGVDPAAAVAAVQAAFGLPTDFVLGTDDPLAGILADNADAAQVFATFAQIENLVILGANTLGEDLAPTPEELFTNTFVDRPNDTREFGAVAVMAQLGLLEQTGGTIDLSDEATLHALIEAAATDVDVTPIGLDAALTDLVARNSGRHRSGRGRPRRHRQPDRACSGGYLVRLCLGIDHLPPAGGQPRSA